MFTHHYVPHVLALFVLLHLQKITKIHLTMIPTV
jgi:hypothetical protein